MLLVYVGASICVYVRKYRKIHSSSCYWVVVFFVGVCGGFLVFLCDVVLLLFVFVGVVVGFFD